MRKEKMKAIICTKYGSPEVLQLREVEKPIPKDNEILIKIKATAVNSGDYRIRKADPFAVRFFFGLTKPKNILGGVLSGEVESIGKDVKRFKVGDEVFGSIGMSFGAYAEYKCLPENATLAIKPNSFSHEEAAVIPFGGNTALFFIKKAKISKGQKVLIYGASGAVGTAAIQLAKVFGAHVTGVCSGANIDLVKSLGADTVIDYTKEDFTRNGMAYDVIFDLKALTEKGVLILASAGISEMLQGLWISMTSGRKVITGVISENTEDMIFIKQLMEEGKIKSVLDRTYNLEQIAEAHTYVEEGHKKGNVAIKV